MNVRLSVVLVRVQRKCETTPHAHGGRAGRTVRCWCRCGCRRVDASAVAGDLCGAVVVCVVVVLWCYCSSFVVVLLLLSLFAVVMLMVCFPP